MRRRLTDPILIQATIAALLSFAHLHDIAEAAGQTGWKSWLYPISVDLLMIAAWRRMRTPGAAKGGAWAWFALALMASLGANVGTSGVMDMEHVPTWLRVVVAGWPAIAFLGGSLLVHSRQHDAPADEPREACAEAPQAPASEPPAPTADEETEEPVSGPEKPVLVSYGEAAEALEVDPATIRGWAFNGRVKKYAASTGNGVRVDLRECKTYQSRRLVGA